MAVFNLKEAKPAPSNAKGIAVWLKDNLFSTPLNVAMTLLGIAFLFWVIPPFVHWAYIDANFAGTTKADCSGDGACWVFIKMKLDMFIYGFYPSDARWRLNFIVVLFIALLIFYNFIKNTKIKFAFFNIFIVSAIFLTVGVYKINYMISINKIIVFLFFFIILYLFKKIKSNAFKAFFLILYLLSSYYLLYGMFALDYFSITNKIIAIILFGLLLSSFILIKDTSIRILLTLLFIVIAIFLTLGVTYVEPIPTDKWGGLMLTIAVASVGIICSFPIGIIVAFGRASNLPIIRSICITYVEFIRGVPLITILFMSSIILPLFFPEGMTFNKLLRALIGITLFQAAYVAEIIRGGLQSIAKGQYEAADAIGLPYWHKMLLVILPQALKVAIPNLVGAFISLFQDTTLVLIIGLFDLLAMVRITAADSHWLGMETEGYVFVTFVFWVFCYGMSKYSIALERRFDTNLK
jgi:general L-amino acid transport system permease protein